jgi:succinate-semialdehyde dehydrogenase/glutarate-semialdehyde dehydrogenase
MRGEILYAAEYGLVGYVYTRDFKRALHPCEGLQTGILGPNRGLVSDAAAPFGGINYHGFGREGGHEGIAE